MYLSLFLTSIFISTILSIVAFSYRLVAPANSPILENADAKTKLEIFCPLYWFEAWKCISVQIYIQLQSSIYKLISPVSTDLKGLLLCDKALKQLPLLSSYMTTSNLKAFDVCWLFLALPFCLKECVQFLDCEQSSALKLQLVTFSKLSSKLSFILFQVLLVLYVGTLAPCWFSTEHSE